MRTNRGALLRPYESAANRPIEKRRRPKSPTSRARLFVRAEASPLRVATYGHASRVLEDSWPSLAPPARTIRREHVVKTTKTKSMDKKVSALYRVYCVSSVPVLSGERRAIAPSAITKDRLTRRLFFRSRSFHSATAGRDQEPPESQSGADSRDRLLLHFTPFRYRKPARQAGASPEGPPRS